MMGLVASGPSLVKLLHLLPFICVPHSFAHCVLYLFDLPTLYPIWHYMVLFGKKETTEVRQISKSVMALTRLLKKKEHEWRLKNNCVQTGCTNHHISKLRDSCSSIGMPCKEDGEWCRDHFSFSLHPLLMLKCLLVHRCKNLTHKHWILNIDRMYWFRKFKLFTESGGICSNGNWGLPIPYHCVIMDNECCDNLQSGLLNKII